MKRAGSRAAVAARVGLAVGLVALTTSFAPREAEADPLIDMGKGDVTVQADTLEVNAATGNAVLNGNVVLSKGDMTVRCPQVDLKFDSSPHLIWAKGSKGVVADVRGVHAVAPEVELDLKRQHLELRGGVKLERGQGWLQADKAVIELATGKVTATQVKGSIPVPKP